MGGPLSNRSGDFPAALQHDSVLRPSDCGGPIVDLSGKAVGINIARAGRVESFALPADQVKPLLKDLMSGKLAPTEAIAAADERKTDRPKPADKSATADKKGTDPAKPSDKAEKK